MRIILELEVQDVERFQQALERAGHAVRSADEHDIVEAAKHALDHLPLAQLPTYVRQRMQRVQGLLAMIEDDDWSLPMPERGNVLKTLAYVADPEDMIPDHIEVIGLLDDAIVLELLLRDQRHVLDAWRDFCAWRRAHGVLSASGDERMRQAARLARRRKALLARMRRRVVRDAGTAARANAEAVLRRSASR